MLKQAQERKRRQSESINEKLREWSLKQKVAEGAYLPHTNPSSDSKKAMPEEQADAPRPDAPDQSDQSGAATSRKNRSREGSEGRMGAMGCSVSESGPLPRRVLDPTGPDRLDPPDHGSLGRGDDALPAKMRASEAGKVPPTPMTLVQDRRRRSHRTESQSSARTKSRRSQSRKDRKGRREGTQNCSGPPPRPPELLAKALPKAPAEPKASGRCEDTAQHKTVDSDCEDEAGFAAPPSVSGMQFGNRHLMASHSSGSVQATAAAMVFEGNRPLKSAAVQLLAKGGQEGAVNRCRLLNQHSCQAPKRCTRVTLCSQQASRVAVAPWQRCLRENPAHNVAALNRYRHNP